MAIPGGRLARQAKTLQRELSTRYRIYREPYPPLHITVGVFVSDAGADGIAPLVEGLNRVIAPYLPLQLYSPGESCFPAPHRSINLAIEPANVLRALSAEVRALAGKAGFTAETFDAWDYHISLVNNNYAAREWTDEEYREACRRIGARRGTFPGATRRLELWDPHFPPLTVLASFPARS